jgi:apolipoprotein N-acyltransferase
VVNVGLVLALSQRGWLRRLLPAAVSMALVLAASVYGAHRLSQRSSSPSLRVAVAQGNIPQEEKWDEALQMKIVQRYARLTRESLRLNPELIVWPETSVPGFLGVEEPLTQQMLELERSIQVPLLVGAPVKDVSPSVWRMTNSAILLEPSGRMAQRYDKTHLVPFGEFIPLESTFPWLRDALPPIGDFAPGHDDTVFRLPELSFSVLICFEDIFPEIARRFVAGGARLLFTITNDAWFGNTAAAYQHAQASTFRAVELRVPMIRAANTGWSGCISAQGEWLSSVRDAAGQELFVEGFAICEPAAGPAASAYLRWGDWFVMACCAATIAWLLALRRRRAAAPHLFHIF